MNIADTQIRKDTTDAFEAHEILNIKTMDDIKVALGNHYQDDLRSFGELHKQLKESTELREKQHIEVMKDIKIIKDMAEPLYKQYAFKLEMSDWAKKQLAISGKILGFIISAVAVWTIFKGWLVMHITTIK